MNKKKLDILTKEELMMAIIKRDDYLLNRALSNLILDKYTNKINDLLNKQTKCDFFTTKGRKEYEILEKQIKKLEKEHSNFCGIQK